MSVNEACGPYWGMAAENAVGNNWMTFLPEHARLAVRANLEPLTAEPPTATIDHEVFAPRGEVSWLRWVSRALFDERNWLIGDQSASRDVTQQKCAKTEWTRRDTLLRVVALISNILLAERELCQVTPKARETIRQASGLGRGNIFECHTSRIPARVWSVSGTSRSNRASAYNWTIRNRKISDSTSGVPGGSLNSDARQRPREVRPVIWRDVTAQNRNPASLRPRSR